MHELYIEKAEEPEIKLSTSTVPQKKQEDSRKTFISASLTLLNPLTVWITNCGKLFKEMGIPDHFTCLLRNLYARQEATDRTGHGRKKKESYPGSQFKSISSFALSLLYGPILISVHDYWKNHIFDNMDLCQQTDVCFLICCLGLSQLFLQILNTESPGKSRYMYTFS